MQKGWFIPSNCFVFKWKEIYSYLSSIDVSNLLLLLSKSSATSDSFFWVSALNNDSELVVKEDATKAEIKRAFAKSLKGKKMNKKILS